MKPMLAIALALALGACESPREEFQAKEDAECRSMGLSPGTPEYIDCRMRLAEAREARIRAAIQAYPMLQNPTPPAYRPPPPSVTRCTNDGYGNITCRESPY